MAASDTAAYFVLKCKGLDTCNAMNIGISGASICSARLADSLSTGSVVLFTDSIINLIIGPKDKPLCGEKAIISVALKPLGGKDTSSVEITVPCAKMVTDTSQDSVVINQVKGGFVIKK
jgi:hypothetical protein